jgi:hypothetical protein
MSSALFPTTPPRYLPWSFPVGAGCGLYLQPALNNDAVPVLLSALVGGQGFSPSVS